MTNLNEIIKRTISGSILLVIMVGAYLHSVTMFSFLLFAMLLVILFFEWPSLMPVKPLWFALITLIYPIAPFLSLIYLNYLYHFESMWLPAYPFLIAWTADTFGYIVGKSIGHHKMCPSISPGKSWEGFFGSFFGVVLINFFLLPKMDIAPFSSYDYIWYFLGTGKSLVALGILSLIQTTIAFLGGLFISKLKRNSNVKDAGYILPGHGGFLDRFDSVLTSVVFIWILVWCKKFLQ